MAITFNNPPKKNFPSRKAMRQVISKTAVNFGHSIADLNYVFVSDEELLAMNQNHLNHNYYTDIITFDLGMESHSIEGDVYISVDRVEENGEKIGNGIEEEFVRVMGHGLLHLLGFRDKLPNEIQEMRQAEDQFIDLYKAHI
ncbi:MAG TPA: rRNA maturation RNase YbeY [Catalimonadaceae bacterium]|nr:rRNA maturation RNase YbeY [Catalimonadaceae bacterium]